MSVLCVCVIHIHAHICTCLRVLCVHVMLVCPVELNPTTDLPVVLDGNSRMW